MSRRVTNGESPPRQGKLRSDSGDTLSPRASRLSGKRGEVRGIAPDGGHPKRASQVSSLARYASNNRLVGDQIEAVDLDLEVWRPSLVVSGEAGGGEEVMGFGCLFPGGDAVPFLVDGLFWQRCKSSFCRG